MTATRPIQKRAAKAIVIPGPGDFLTDGHRLVEVVGVERNGLRVLDGLAEADDLIEHDQDATEILNMQVALRAWRIVKPSTEAQVVA